MDSEEEALDDLEFEGSSDENAIDEDILDALEEDLAAEEASEAAAEVSHSTRFHTLSYAMLTLLQLQDSESDDSDNGSDEDNDDDELPRRPPPQNGEVQPDETAPGHPPAQVSPSRELPQQQPLHIKCNTYSIHTFKFYN
jgi:transcriptional activator SPT8